MQFAGLTINQGLLDQQEVDLFRNDLERYASTLEEGVLEKADKVEELKPFLKGYQDWKDRQFNNLQHPLPSYFLVEKPPRRIQYVDIPII